VAWWFIRARGAPWGRRRLTSREVDGKKSSDDEINDVIGTADGLAKFSVRSGDKLIGEGAMTLDPTKKPKATDVSYTEGERKGKTALAIYEMGSDTFRICVAHPGGERPTEFSAKAGSGCTLIVYKRDKK
jgi:uncharacterized protein (TIGR03067 family)